ncbi:MAG: DUF4286 family protein [[Clostridium] fimetarium]|nr:DUF4286 family protein [Alistipes timonensis]MCM1405203.1 DUF4286 family protein [[Clostridium] fimetarium]
MVIQNTTFVISDDIEKEFFHWLRTELVPAVKGSGVYAADPSLMLILASAEPGTKNFAFQTRTDNLDAAQAWLCEGEGARLLGEITRKMEGRMAHFSTFMAEIEL